MTLKGPSEINPSHMMTGINQVGAGWHPLVRKLESKLLDIDPDYQLQQVKEKFGGLRYYAQSQVDPEFEGLFHTTISEYEERSFSTCELCGQPGTLDQSGHWLKTLCDRHRAERQTARRKADFNV
jgi:hypothetical protein